MDIKSIKAIVNSDLSEEIKIDSILQIIAMDKKSIPYILKTLEKERESNKELILDSNSELSRALIILSDNNLKWNKKIVTDPNWVIGEIKKHYHKWAGVIKCNFKIEGLP